MKVNVISNNNKSKNSILFTTEIELGGFTTDLSFLLLGFFVFVFVFLGLHPQHMDVPRLGVKSELQLPAYTTATDSNMGSGCAYNLHCSSWQRQILNPRGRPGIEPTSS